MKSAALGRHISGAEVTNVSKHGFWLLLANEELFVPFKDFPWFKDASIAEIVRVEWPQPHHLYWPDLDVDLAVESIRHPRHPENFPLISKKTHPHPSAPMNKDRARLAHHNSSVDCRLCGEPTDTLPSILKCVIARRDPARSVPVELHLYGTSQFAEARPTNSLDTCLPTAGQLTNLLLTQRPVTNR